MADNKAKKVVAKVKQPSTLKRELQNEKRRVRNRSYRASVLTSIRSLEAAISKKDTAEDVKLKLNEVYSLMDKGVKRGVFKANKAARTKSRLFARCTKTV